MDRRLLTAIGSASLLVAALLPASAVAADPEVTSRLDRPARASMEAPRVQVDREIAAAKGRIQAIVRLTQAPTARTRANARAAQLGRIRTQQDRVWRVLRGADGTAKLHGRTRVALNALLVTADAAALRKLARDGNVARISAVRDYELDLPETVPHIGATALTNETGLTGEGVTIAVLDSGIDYTHAAFGGPGTLLAYKNAYGVKTKDTKNTKINDAYKGAKLFPTDKVVGGWDFVGEAWDGSATTPPLQPDPDPIDCSPVVIGCDGGHGTHVADIAAGLGGVAPGADLLAVKVCSSVSTACSGTALIQGMDFALDPNRDGNPNDAADIINMSLGSPYGQAPEDDLSTAVEAATVIGTLVVTSSGNSGDKPYVTGTPGAAPSALSTAQTAVPSSTGFAMLLSTGGASTPREAVFQSWSKPLTAADAVTDAPVQYGDGAGGNLDGCAAFAAGSLTGKVVLVDRGTCNFSAKIANIANAGGKIGVIGLIAPGDPFDGALGDCPNEGCHAIPGYMVGQATSTAMKNPAARVTFDPANGIPLIHHIVGSSSRGPDNARNLIKPEIGAPGGSVSALVGTGTGTEPFSGTSGAAPMVTGSAALLREAYPGRGPLEIKAVLINTGYTQIMNRPAVFGGDLAPITRIGGGEVRVNAAHATDVAAWEDGGTSAALSFGFHDITADGGNSVTKTVRVRNYGSSAVTYAVSSTFRFADDVANAAVSVSVPSSVTVAAGGSTTFPVTISLDGSSLRTWNLDSGLQGANAARLQALEYDGYVWLDAAGSADDIHLPWQVLPRKAAAITPSATSVASGGSVTLTNGGVGAASVTSLALVATDPDDVATPTGDNVADLDLRYVGVRSVTGDLATDGLGCEAGVGFLFGVTTWDRQVHAVAPGLFEFDIDTDGDGDADYAVFNADLAGLAQVSDGRNVTWALDLATGDATAFFAVVHSTNSGNTTLTICGEQIGLDAGDAGATLGVELFAVDWYNSGQVSDTAAFDMVVAGDRYAASFSGPFAAFGQIGTTFGASSTVTLTDAGAAGRNPTETGVLLTLDGWLLGAGGAPADAETLVLSVSP